MDNMEISIKNLEINKKELECIPSRLCKQQFSNRIFTKREILKVRPPESAKSFSTEFQRNLRAITHCTSDNNDNISDSNERTYLEENDLMRCCLFDERKKKRERERKNFIAFLMFTNKLSKSAVGDRAGAARLYRIHISALSHTARVSLTNSRVT